jgi:hypothetical protein
MTAHAHSHTPAGPLLAPARPVSSTRSGSPGAAPSHGMLRRHAGSLWSALLAIGAARARRELLRAAALYAVSRPESAVALRRAAGRIQG